MILSPFAVFIRWQETFAYLAAVARQEARSKLPQADSVDRYDDRGLRVFDTAYGELDALRRLLPEPLDRMCFVSPRDIKRACENQVAEEYDAEREAQWRLRKTLAGELS